MNKFIIDANLPRRLARWLKEKGYDCIHTLELPEKNLTEDDFVNMISMKEQRIVVSKDKDFLNSFLLKREPYKLILITAGNLPNDELISIFEKSLESMLNILESDFFIEVDQETITTHS
ncbi:MAG: DUF5615 family PIN-like protein [Leptospiraceae bacterium]|nr:DUF5615 family PIN-like protein [Leptospiraceae bacterium]